MNAGFLPAFDADLFYCAGGGTGPINQENGYYRWDLYLTIKQPFFDYNGARFVSAATELVAASNNNLINQTLSAHTYTNGFLLKQGDLFTGDVTINSNTLLEDIRDFYSVGVEYNEQNETFDLKHIPEFFEDTEILRIEENDIDSLNIEINQELAFNRIKLGQPNSSLTSIKMRIRIL